MIGRKIRDVFIYIGIAIGLTLLYIVMAVVAIAACIVAIPFTPALAIARTIGIHKEEKMKREA